MDWPEFVVTDQDYSSVLTRKCCHAIVRMRNEKTVVHALASFGYDGIAVAIRQIEDAVRVGAQWPHRRIGCSAGYGKGRNRNGNTEVLEKEASVHELVET